MHTHPYPFHNFILVVVQGSDELSSEGGYARKFASLTFTKINYVDGPGKVGVPACLRYVESIAVK